MTVPQPLWKEFLRHVMVAQHVAETFSPDAPDEADVRKSMNRYFQLCHKSLNTFLLSCVKSDDSNLIDSLNSEIYQDSNNDSHMRQEVFKRGYPRTPDGSPNESIENISASEQIKHLFKNGTPSPDYNRETSEARNRSSMSRPPSPSRSQDRSNSRTPPKSNHENKAQTIRSSHFRGPSNNYSSQSPPPATRPRSPSYSDREDSSYDRRTRKRYHHSGRSREHRNRSSKRSLSPSRSHSRHHAKYCRRSRKSPQRTTTRRRSRSISNRKIRSPSRMVTTTSKPSISSSTSRDQSQFIRENRTTSTNIVYQNISDSASPLPNINEQGTSSLYDYGETLRFHQQYSMAYYQPQQQRMTSRYVSYHEPLRVPHPYYFPRRH